MNTLKDFWEDQAKWSQETFGNDNIRGPKGPLLHLKKEVEEALAELEKGKIDYRALNNEIVDCLFLVFDSARRNGMSYELLVMLAFEKLKINKTRKWSKAEPDKPAEHIREVS